MPRGPKGEKHPADVNARAVMVARIATGEVDDTLEDDGKDPAAKALGKKGRGADYLVELRGFEPPTSAVQIPARFTAPSLPVLQGLLSKARRWIPP